MTRYFNLHAENPQKRLIGQAVEALKDGEIIAYPTDSAYALGCTLTNRMGVEVIRRIRKLEEKHPMTLICSDISQAAQYAIIADQAYKILKKLTPGAYTFLLPATKNISKIVQGSKRKEVGIRIPNHEIALALVRELGEPILSSTLWLPGDEAPIDDASLIAALTDRMVNLVLDAGFCEPAATTVIDLLGDIPKVVRIGVGDINF